MGKTANIVAGFSARLREAMAAETMRAAELARQAGVSPGYVSGLLRGNVKPSESSVRNMAEVLRCRVEWLARNIGPMRLSGARPPWLTDEDEEFLKRLRAVEIELQQPIRDLVLKLEGYKPAVKPKRGNRSNA